MTARDMTIAAFTTGGMIIDNMVTWDGRLARDLVGGNAVYSAVGASLWLDDVGLCARIPQNYPRSARQALEMTALDLGGVVAEPAQVHRSEWFFHRPDGSRADHLHATHDEADAFGMTGHQVPPDMVRLFEARLSTQGDTGDSFKAFRAAHPVTISQVPPHYWQARGLHLGPNLPEAQIGLAREARSRGLIVTCDPGFHAAHLGRGQLDELLGLVDAFLPSEKELALLCPGAEPQLALHQLSQRARAMVGVKCGAKGALVLPKEQASPVHVPALPATALDPTGAGDAFCGGFLAGLLLGDDAFHAGLRGAVSASLAIETAGALPTSAAPLQAMQRLAQARLSHPMFSQAHRNS
jgi:pfkB family carbohydrate kinase